MVALLFSYLRAELLVGTEHCWCFMVSFAGRGMWIETSSLGIFFHDFTFTFRVVYQVPAVWVPRTFHLAPFLSI